MRVTLYVFASVILLNIYSIDAVDGTGDNLSEAVHNSDVSQIHVSVWEKFVFDKLTGYNQGLRDIYRCALNLLVHRMQSWLTHKDPSSTTVNTTYMGFPDKTINLINVVFTLLISQSYEAAGLVRITNLAEAFFYSCDIDHMHDSRDADRVVYIEQNFRNILKNLQIEYAQGVAHNHTEDELVAELTSKVKSSNVQVLVEPWYSVAVVLIKNWVFLGKTDDRTVNKLQESFLAEYKRNDAVKYETETDVDRVIENHVTFIGKIVPELFGLAYNHIELVIKLSRVLKREGINDDDPMPVTIHPNKCIEVFNIFLHRYFHFKRIPSDETIASAISSLSKFFESNEDNLNAWSITKYRDADVIQMWDLLNDALAKLLAYFGRGNIEEWKIKSTVIIDYPDGEQSLSELWGLMDGNIEDAFNFYEFISGKLTQRVI